MSILGGDHVLIPRRSSVYIGGRYHDWPLTLGSAFRLPLRIAVPSALDLVFRPRHMQIDSFADHVISRYGRNLYRHFFDGYTRKFTGQGADSLHCDWARAGVDRAVIDKRVKADSLTSLMKGLLMPRPVSTTFVYPGSGGISSFCNRLLEKIVDAHGMIITGAEATGVISEDGRVRGVRLAGGRTVEADRVFWSAPLSVLFPELGFRFINTVVYNIAFQKSQGIDWQWCYFGSPDISFSRLTVPGNFREDTVPMARDSMIAEITCGPDDPVWRDPGAMMPVIIEDLERVGAARSADVLFVRPERIRETYPVYDLAYRQKVRRVMLELPEGLTLLGRCGCFWYNNMDHSLSQALGYASGSSGFTRDFWSGSSS